MDLYVIMCKDLVKEMKHVELSGGKGMLAIERQEQIVSQIRRNGAVRIHELTKQFGVSVETIRRVFWNWNGRIVMLGYTAVQSA